MKVNFKVTVSSDDGTIARTAENELLIDTGIEGVDPATAKYAFISQAEGLFRTISDNQMPALYQSVADAQQAAAEAAADGADKISDRMQAIRGKRMKKSTGAGSNTSGDKAQAVQDSTPSDPVACTECGATVAHDDAHFVSVVQDGKYQKDAVLCDACFRKEMDMRGDQAGENHATAEAEQ